MPSPWEEETRNIFYLIRQRLSNGFDCYHLLRMGRMSVNVGRTVLCNLISIRMRQR
jgi:hypothetical protein